MNKGLLEYATFFSTCPAESCLLLKSGVQTSKVRFLSHGNLDVYIQDWLKAIAANGKTGIPLESTCE